MRYNYKPGRMAKIWNTDNTKWWWEWGCGAKGTNWLQVGMQKGMATLDDGLAICYKSQT